MKAGKKLLAALMILALCLALCGCAKTYHACSSRLLLYQQELSGPGIGRDDATLILKDGNMRNGAELELEYFGRRYKAEIWDGFVIWDGSKPDLVAGGDLAYTQIYEVSKGVKLLFGVRYEGVYLDYELVFRK